VKDAGKKGDMRAALVLEDGSVWEGSGFGAPGVITGEVVFNTGMMGYTQSVTDPSYHGQILCQTYPLIGNYGVDSAEFESDSPKITAYIVYEACGAPSHHTSEMGLDRWLRMNRIPGIEGVDTREITKILRTRGTMLGAMSVSMQPPDIKRLISRAKSAKDPNERDLVSEVTVKEPVKYEGSGKRVVIIDCGTKLGIVGSLRERGAEVIRVPADWGADRITGLKPDGVVISNGPGDPKKVPYVVRSAKNLMEHGMPMLGICLGNQVLGLALGCDTYKLKFGHRGQNHPVMDTSTKKCYITSQNHGYAINPDSVSDKDVEISFTNVNDGTVEGIEHKKLKVFGVQFHPEARPGPVETGSLFDRFMKNMGDGHAKA
jgi:carbamoyl-phosphate synthase small subunit